MNIIEKAKRDTLKNYGGDPLYRNFLIAEDSEDQSRHKDILISIRGDLTYKNLCRYFKERVRFYKINSEKKG